MAVYFWIASSNFWLRGATVTNSTNFCNVNNNGGVNTGNNNNNATNSYGVCPRFSLFK